MGKMILNGKEYTSSPKDGFPPIIYSDEEREIGVWRNGKPLYERTYICSVSDLVNSTVNSSQISGEYHFVNTDTSKWDMYRLIEGQLFNFGNTVNTVKSNWLNYPSSNAYIRCNLQQVNNQGDIFAYINLTYSASNFYNDRSNIKFCFVIQYTKTTDVAGSGKYTTYGGLTHHYSTSEQVVGTWIDGKPLYEKTYVNSGSDITANGGTWTTVCSESWAQSVKQITSSLLSRQPYSSSSAGISTPCEFIAESGAIKINPFRNLTFKTNAFFVIQYTKTSD